MKPMTDHKRLLICLTWLGLIAIIAAIVALVVMKIEIDATLLNFLSMIATALTFILKEASGFEFGSSMGSQKKDAALAAGASPDSTARNGGS